MSRKKRVGPRVQAHIDWINSAGDVRTLNAIFNAIEAQRGSDDDDVAADAADVEVFRAYRARHIALAGRMPELAERLADPDQQDGFRALVRRLEDFTQELNATAAADANPAAYMTPDVRAMARVSGDLAATLARLSARCQATAQRSPFALVPGFGQPSDEPHERPDLQLIRGEKASRPAS